MTGGTAEKTVTIANTKGLHARASAKFVSLAETFDADIHVTGPGAGAQLERVCGTSIMGLMMLAAAKGQEISIDATGPEAEAAVAALAALVNDRFQED